MTTQEEALRLYRLLDPHRGRWIAVDFGWTTIFAFHADRAECIRVAKTLQLEKQPIIHFVPGAPPPPKQPEFADAPVFPGDMAGFASAAR